MGGVKICGIGLAEEARAAVRAVARVRPWMVDVCSGVRVDDQLDETRLNALLKTLGRGI